MESKTIRLPEEKCVDKTILALGAEMTSSFCILKDKVATLSPPLGNTADAEVFKKYKDTVEGFLELSGLKPEVILCDAHPSYNVSRYAAELANRLCIPLVKVQHHLAHAYSVAAEHEFCEFASIICDGLGYGTDGNIWGGEVFMNGERVGHLEEQYQLGGDSATIYPAKFLYAILAKFMDEEELIDFMSKYFDLGELQMLKQQLINKINCPVTSSCGRIFDAASVLLGFCTRREYDGSPAIELEKNSTEPYDLIPIVENGVLYTTPLFEFLVANLDLDKSRLAATVQKYVAEGLYLIAREHSATVMFSGGCAVNKIMQEFLMGRGVFMNREVPCGDGGIALGQIVYHCCKLNGKH